jgi:hypothetical protein
MDGTQDLAIQRPLERRRGSGTRVVLLIWLLMAIALGLPGDRAGPGVTSPAPAEDEPIPNASDAPALFPTSDLLYRVPARYRQNCVPFANNGFPYESVECSEGLSRAYYTRFASVAAMDAHFDSQIGHLNLPLIPGGCKAGVPSQDTWHYTHSAERPEGRMACFMMADNVPITFLTQPEQRLVAVVISNPSLGWPGHHEAWANRVPNPPADRQPPGPSVGEG